MESSMEKAPTFMLIRTHMLDGGCLERRKETALILTVRLEWNLWVTGKTIQSPRADGSSPTVPTTKASLPITSPMKLAHGTTLMETLFKGPTNRPSCPMKMRKTKHSTSNLIGKVALESPKAHGKSMLIKSFDLLKSHFPRLSNSFSFCFDKNSLKLINWQLTQTGGLIYFLQVSWVNTISKMNLDGPEPMK